MTTTNHSFTPSSLTSIMMLGFSSSMLLSRWCSVPFHLRHIVGDMSTYKSKEYFVVCISDMIRDDGREQESDNKDPDG